MFDRIYDAKGEEWQTKAFGRTLKSYNLGDAMPVPFTFQVEVLGGDHHLNYVDSFATVRDGYLTAVPDQRDETLPLLNYGGAWIAAPKGS
jgi:hypothetical protein